ncbi:MAG: T9SS type A sorting domain-containing protein [Salinivirgaceae bacterium]
MRKVFTILIALLLSFTWAQAQSKGGKLIYSQLGNIVNNETGYFSYNGGSAPMGTGIYYSADDFTVPAEGMDVYGATVIFNRSPYYFSGFKVDIYSDNAGIPSTTAVESFNIEVFEAVELEFEVTRITIEFPYAAELTSGTYWLSVVGNGQWVSGQWLTLSDVSAMGNPAKQKDISGFPKVYLDWSTKNDEYNNNGMYTNLAFGLVGPPDDNDLTLKTILAPKSGELKALSDVKVAIQNVGLLTQTNFNVMYQVSATVDGVLTQIGTSTESVTGANIGEKEILEYTFTQKVDLSAITTYSVKTAVMLTGDANPANDIAYGEARNYGELYIMGTDTIVTACDGIFVDDGSVLGNYTDASSDTITFLPGTVGSRVALDFTFMNAEGDIQNWDFYDGKTTDAPKLFELVRYSGVFPTYVQARNADGAITVVVKVEGAWGYPGWEANVNCVTPNAIEFSTLNLTVGDPLVYNQVGKPVDVLAVVTNAGADTTSRAVYLVVNGEVVETQMTKNLIPGVIDSLHFNWIPTLASANTTVKVLIQNDGQATNDDNSLETTVKVYNQGALLESFEGSLSLPLAWVSKLNTAKVSEYYNSTHGKNSLNILFNDTVVTPLTEIGVVDKLYFDAYAAGNGDSKAIQVLMSKSIEGPWDTLGLAVRPTGVYGISPYEFDLSMYAGDVYYFAFTNLGANSYSTSYIDNVRGAKLYYFEKDLYTTGITAQSYVKAGIETKLNVSVNNLGTTAILGSDYTIEVTGVDTVYTVVNGVDIASMENAAIVVPYTFQTLDTVSIYANIVLVGETRIDNNRSKTIEIIITDNYVAGGIDNGSTTSSVVQINRKSSISEMVYYPSEIGLYGDLNGIEFTYNFSYPAVDTVPVHIYMATMVDSFLVDTAVSLYTATWIETDSISFTEVYNGKMNFQQGNNLSMYIPLDVPFAYNGTDNIVLMIIKDSTATISKYPYFHTMANTKSRFLYGQNTTNQIHSDSIVVQYGGSVNSYQMPLAIWHFSNPGAPVFESEPIVSINEMENYNYTIEVAYQSITTFEVMGNNLPEWMTLSALTDTTYSLSGTAVAGMYSIGLMVTDGKYSAEQNFNLKVNAIPEFVSESDSLTLINELYSYTAEVTYNGESAAVITGGTANPSWLTVTDNGDNTATVSGTPDAVGDFTITVIAEGDVTTEQVYTLTVGAMPTFAAITDAMINEGAAYSATATVSYEGVETLTISAGTDFPTWLTLTDNGDKTATIAGTTVTGEYVVNLVATDGTYETSVSYLITVMAVPVFTSEPVISGNVDEIYTYNVVVAYTGDDALLVNADVPAWATLTNNGDGTATLTGTPDATGIYPVSILAIGKYNYATQTFSITVDPNGVGSVEAGSFNIYPNPATNFITIVGSVDSKMEIFDITGQLVLSKVILTTSDKVDVSILTKGIYVVSVTNEMGKISQRLVIE